MKATVITDASFCPETKSAGWAIWVAHDKGARIKKYGNFKRMPKDSGMAELWAAINGIAYATRAGAKSILLQTDCTYVVKLLNEHPDKIYEALRLVKIEERPTVKVFHVKGHTNSSWSGAKYWVNRWCDKHAGIAMRTQRKSATT